MTMIRRPLIASIYYRLADFPDVVTLVRSVASGDDWAACEAGCGRHPQVVFSAPGEASTCSACTFAWVSSGPGVVLLAASGYLSSADRP